MKRLTLILICLVSGCSSQKPKIVEIPVEQTKVVKGKDKHFVLVVETIASDDLHTPSEAFDFHSKKKCKTSESTND